MDDGFAKSLAELRRSRGLSQRVVASELGISQALLSHYENGAREPGLGFVCRACDYYGVSADYMLCREGFTPRGARDSWAEVSSLAGALIAQLGEIGDAGLDEAAARHMCSTVVMLHMLLSGSLSAGMETVLAAEMGISRLRLLRAAERLEKAGGLPLKELPAEVGEAAEKIKAFIDSVLLAPEE